MSTEPNEPTHFENVDDKYGDFAINKPPYKIDPYQVFWRGVANMRRREIEYWSVPREVRPPRVDDTWRTAIRGKWRGAWLAFDPEMAEEGIPEPLLEEASAFVLRGDTKNVPWEKLQPVLFKFYSDVWTAEGKTARLMEELDILTGYTIELSKADTEVFVKAVLDDDGSDLL